MEFDGHFCFPARTLLFRTPERRTVTTTPPHVVPANEIPRWNVPEPTDRLRALPLKPKRKSLVQISLPRPARRHHPQALIRPRRNHAGLGPQERFLFQPQADHA